MATHNRNNRSRHEMKWAVWLAMMGAASLQIGCKSMCTCQVPPEEPGKALATAAAQPAPAAASAPAGGGAATAPSVKYNWKNVVILGGGFVTGVIFSPAEKDLVYARTDVGGAYRWNPADKSWIALTDNLGRDSNNIGIESLATDPTDANKVYIATGTYTGSWVGNGAIMRSSDRGKTWQVTDMPVKMGGNENGRSMGERLVVDP